jgi:hypothetical protein
VVISVLTIASSNLEATHDLISFGCRSFTHQSSHFTSCLGPLLQSDSPGMTTPESPVPPRSPSFYIFRSNSAIPPPTPQTHSNDSFIHDILPHLARQTIRSVTAVILPIVLLPFHFFLFVLSVITTLLAALFLSWRAFMVYVDIGFNTASQVYSDYAFGGKRIGRRRRDLLRRVVLEREEAVRAENNRPLQRGRGLTIA